jgi:hypothetical protein
LVSGVELASDEEDDGLVWPTAALADIEMINNGRKIRFMLDLTALEARFQNLSLFRCMATGGRCLYSNPRDVEMEKNTGLGATAAGTGGTGTSGTLWIDCQSE